MHNECKLTDKEVVVTSNIQHASQGNTHESRKISGFKKTNGSMESFLRKERMEKETQGIGRNIRTVFCFVGDSFCY